MNIKEPKRVTSVEKPAAAAPAAPIAKRERPATDAVGAERVTVSDQQTSGARAARFAQLASAIKAGHYRPDPGHLADQLLDTAELDARLRAMLKG